MEISAKSDYAIRALLVLAADRTAEPVRGEVVASRQGMPAKFVENILVDLRRYGLVKSFRGSAGGFRLARPAAEITLAQVLRAVEGPLVQVRGGLPEDTAYAAPAADLQLVWIAVRSSMRAVFETVTLADVVDGALPAHIVELTLLPEAWKVR